MYGLLCESLHDFIKESYGDDVWKLVRERADVRLHSFVTHQVQSLEMRLNRSAQMKHYLHVGMCVCVSAGVQRERDPTYCEGSQWSHRHALQWADELLGSLLPGLCREIRLWQDPQGEKKNRLENSANFMELSKKIILNCIFLLLFSTHSVIKLTLKLPDWW